MPTDHMVNALAPLSFLHVSRRIPEDESPFPSDAAREAGPGIRATFHINTLAMFIYCML